MKVSDLKIGQTYKVKVRIPPLRAGAQITPFGGGAVRMNPGLVGVNTIQEMKLVERNGRMCVMEVPCWTLPPERNTAQISASPSPGYIRSTRRVKVSSNNILEEA